MLTVSNTSPILNLAIIGKLFLLKDQFKSIVIPEAVKNELRIQEELPGCIEIRNALKDGWIDVRKVEDKHKVQLLNIDLDKGEAEAIALALQLNADLVLIDERDARKFCKSLGLRVTGIIGIILKARKTGSIDSVKELLDDLINYAGFRINSELYDKVLNENSRK